MNRQFLRLLLSAVLIVFVALLTLAITQTVAFTPLDPVEWHPADTEITNVWTYEVGGNQFSSIQGNYTRASSASNPTILLNTVNLPTPASVTYQIPLALAQDAAGGSTEISVYIPNGLFFANQSAPLIVSIGGTVFTYQPTQAENFSWHPSGPVWVPAATDLVGIPGHPALGNTWLEFSANTTKPNQALPVSISVSPFNQIYISDVVVVATGPPFAFQPQLSQEMGLWLLPLLAGGLVATLLLIRKLISPALVQLLTAGIILRIAIAPLFFHADFLGELRYPLQLYDGGSLGIGTFGYGPVWLGELVTPPAALYALGINPTVNSLNVLVKLPNIVFDALTYLLLYRLLARRFQASKARLWATFAWWLNPLVVYFGAAHGLYESTVGFFVLCGFVGYSELRVWLGSTSLAIAVSSILATAVMLPIALIRRSILWKDRILLIVLPVVLYTVIGIAVSGSGSVLVTYLSGMIGRGSGSSSIFGTAVYSQMSPLTVIYAHTGISISAELSIIVVTAVAASWALSGRNLSALQLGWAGYASLLAFYFAYPTFYVQHLLWALPLLILLLAVSTDGHLRSLALVLIISVLAFAINWLAYWAGNQDPYISFSLFLLLVLPLLVYTMTGRRLISFARAHLLHLQCLAAVSLVVVLLWQSLPGGLTDEVLLGAFSIGLVGRLLAKRLPHSLAAATTPACLVAVISAPWWMLYNLAGSGPNLEQFVFLGLCLYALTELGLLLASHFPQSSGAGPLLGNDLTNSVPFRHDAELGQ